MIGFLRGSIIEKLLTAVLVEVQGVGYEVRVTTSTLSLVNVNDECLFYIYEHIREDCHDLYGFLAMDEKRFFEKLISVSGIGPRTALGILSSGQISEIKDAIATGNVTRLSGVHGIGKKTAQKIVLELKGQLVEDETVTDSDRDLVGALISLGYTPSQAKEAASHVEPGVTDISDRVREALKYVSK